MPGFLIVVPQALHVFCSLTQQDNEQWRQQTSDDSSILRVTSATTGSAVRYDALCEEKLVKRFHATPQPRIISLSGVILQEVQHTWRTTTPSEETREQQSVAYAVAVSAAISQEGKWEDVS